MAYLASRYARYDTGGMTPQAQKNWNLAAGVAGTAAGAIDSFNQPNQFGARSVGASAASGALKGASMGAVAGPWGAVVGGVVGGAYGAISSALGNQKAEGRQNQYLAQVHNNDAMRSQAMLANNPEAATGYQNGSYYKNGGPLSRNFLSSMYVEGGNLKTLNSQDVEVEGPSHANGGVQLPGAQAEVEGGETMNNDFVFSEQLGYAQEHKKLAKAIGKIEAKGTVTPEKTNAIERMQGRQESLKLAQEYHKSLIGLS